MKQRFDLAVLAADGYKVYLAPLISSTETNPMVAHVCALERNASLNTPQRIPGFQDVVAYR